MKLGKTLILASNSPRRRQLLSLGGYSFDIAPAEIDETPYPGENARKYVLRMAEMKAKAVAAQAVKGSLVIGADTTVVDLGDQGEEEILGKPIDEEEAILMLQRLRGRVHLVLTSVAIVSSDDDTMFRDVCTTQVKMREYSDEEIRAYVESGDPLDKAGAYAIQHPEFNPVQSLTGCYPNVVGLPLCYIVKALNKFGLAPGSDIIRECQLDRQSPCLVYQQALRGEAYPGVN